MEYRQLGRSGFKVPELCFGCGTFGGHDDEFFKAWGAADVEEARKIVDICMEAGLNFFDTADIYSFGASESVLGAAIQHLRREDVLISTKATFRFGPGPNDVGSSRYHLTQALEGSLKRLGTDYIDVYHMHETDSLTPVEETLATLDKFVRDGKVALHCLLQLLRMASDEVAHRQRAPWLGPLRRPSGLLLAAEPRIRVGADAPRARPGSGRAHLVAARLGPPHRQDPPRNRHPKKQPTQLRSSSSTSARKSPRNISTKS